MIMNDRWIKEMADQHRMIEPFVPSLVSDGKISCGVSSFGYDFRLSNEFRVFQGCGDDILDPKRVREDLFATFSGNECHIPPHSYILGRSEEYFRIPRNILAICAGKSTYARCGIVVNVTPLEPEWEGFITISISNTAPVAVRVYPGEGIGQVVFLEGSPPLVSYADRKGKYQTQRMLTLSKI
jgi:dCTP deaminase